MRRRDVLMAGAGVALAGTVPRMAEAQAFPTRPVRVLIGYGPGGLGDVTTRLVTDKVGAKLGQPFIIENRPGAGGIVASQSFMQTQTDGYTLMMAASGNVAMTPGLFRSVPFDPVADFSPICLTCSFGFAFAVRADSPFRSLRDLVAAAKREPNAVNIATIFTGSAQHVGTELFKAMAGVQMTTVPYRTTGEVLAAVQGGQAPVIFEAVASLVPMFASGMLRPLAVTSPRRFSLLPDVPTVQEQGVADYEVTSWNGLVARKGTPEAVIGVLNAAMNDALRQPDVLEKMRSLAVEPGGGTPAHFAEIIRADVARWREAIAIAGIERQ
jgi:tripartite-type tricarboxylate transporter receptor subunit TctC